MSEEKNNLHEDENIQKLTKLDVNEMPMQNENENCENTEVVGDKEKGAVSSNNSCCNNEDGLKSCNKNNCSTEIIINDEDWQPPAPGEQQNIFLTDDFLGKNFEYKESLQDFDDSSHPLTERWSPLGANYDDTISPNGSDLLSPKSEMELLSLSGSPRKRDVMDDELKDIARLRYMEEEQELLTSSLLALTSHFAHVQLRVRQIVEANPVERDQLLKDLNEFAFQGIPEPISSNVITNAPKLSLKEISQMDQNDQTRQRQCELIEHLKSQLCELEKLAYESGAPVLPQHILLEKQKLIIDELKNKLNLKVEEHELPQLSSEEIRCQVENAIGEIVGPLKMKEQLVAQLKTQITDLERFIFYLQCDSDGSKMKTLNGSNEKFMGAYNSYAAKTKRTTLQSGTNQSPLADNFSHQILKSSSSENSRTSSQNVKESLNSKAHGLMDKASVLMQMFASTHFGPKTDTFQKNTLKKTRKGNHWGDLRAQLEVDIQEVASLAATLSFDREKLQSLKRAMKTSQQIKAKDSNVGSLSTIQPFADSHYQDSTNNCYAISSDSDEDTYNCYDWRQNMNRARYKGDSVQTLSRELTTAVRKNLAMTLQQLIQHGLQDEKSSPAANILVPFLRCFNTPPFLDSEHSDRDCTIPSSTSERLHARDDYVDNSDSSIFGGNNNGSRPMHAWELILEYYYLKNGDDYNNTPARKLSESFNLEIIDSKRITAKHNLLRTIGSIIALHRPYKRSCNAHFKAFVCAGLNAKQLAEWLNLIFSCKSLVETYYRTNSYVMRTGFRDSLRSIDTLTKYDFDLPVDLAVRHFKNF